MVVVKFYKVTSLPQIAEPDSFYYVENGQYAESYLTDSGGILKKIGNSQMIDDLTKDIDGGFYA